MNQLKVKKIYKIIAAVLICIGLLFAEPASVNCKESQSEYDKYIDKNNSKITIGIAWTTNQNSGFEGAITAIEKTGAKAVALNQVQANYLQYSSDKKKSINGGNQDLYTLNKTNSSTNTKQKTDIQELAQDSADILKSNRWKNSNVESVMKNIDAVIFLGGGAVSPSLYKTPAEPIDSFEGYCAERDVSDYILTCYCLDKNIPSLSFCRNMEMLSIINGATLTQDLPTYYTAHGVDKSLLYTHRMKNKKNRDYVSHEIDINKNTKIYDMYNSTRVDNVLSWHHQAVLSINNPKIKVGATNKRGNVVIIEEIERTDTTFNVGLQFHPEAAVEKLVNKKVDSEMTFDDAMKPFVALVNAANK